MKPVSKSAILFSLFISSAAYAQDEVVSKEFSQTLLTIAIVLGILASCYVFVLSIKLDGGVIASTLLLYGAGMLSVVTSLLSVTWLKSSLGSYAGVSHDAFFIIGFFLMVVGSIRIARMIG
ncbi:MAG: hypothetical protein GY806_14835 [Gammaproteobacteria bacterium]|nr:hypothetical protein [Gammaproteobacteria bacterium]